MKIDVNNPLHKLLLSELLSSIEIYFSEISEKLNDKSYSKNDMELNTKMVNKLLEDSAKLIEEFHDILEKDPEEISNRLNLILKDQ